MFADYQYNDTQRVDKKDTQYTKCDTQHNGIVVICPVSFILCVCVTNKPSMLRVVMLIVVILITIMLWRPFVNIFKCSAWVGSRLTYKSIKRLKMLNRDTPH